MKNQVRALMSFNTTYSGLSADLGIQHETPQSFCYSRKTLCVEALWSEGPFMLLTGTINDWSHPTDNHSASGSLPSPKWGFLKVGTPSWGSPNFGSRILGSILGSPYYGKLPNVRASILVPWRVAPFKPEAMLE